MNLNEDCISLIIDKSNNDYRRLINILYELYLMFGDNLIKRSKITSLLNTIGDKNIDMNLSEITNKIITKKLLQIIY